MKMIKRLHYVDFFGRKRVLKIVETVILILYFSTVVFDSTLKFFVARTLRYIACCKVVIFDIRRLGMFLFETLSIYIPKPKIV